MQATAVAKRAGAKKLLLFHHDPSHSDAELKSILSQARERFKETYLAVEGETHGIEG